MASSFPQIYYLHAFLFLLLASLSCPTVARPLPSFADSLALVPSVPLVLPYHDGPLLTQPLSLHLLWYGSFSPSQKAIVSDLLSSFEGTDSALQPSVASWWKTARLFRDKSKAFISPRVSLGQVSSDPSYSIGKNLTQSDIAKLVEQFLANGVLPGGSDGVYLVLTAEDVLVEQFCLSSCGSHGVTIASPATKTQSLPYIWVGNSAKQCPGFCAWPYAVQEFGPPYPPLVSPNRDVGMDGMVINIATQLVDTVTNPFNTGYFQGEAIDPLEAVTACAGKFGKNSYPGYAGDLLVDKSTKASYNAVGLNKRMFLLPAMWSPLTLECKTVG